MKMSSLTISVLSVELDFRGKKNKITRIKSKELYIYKQKKAYLNQIKNKVAYKTVLVGHAFLSKHYFCFCFLKAKDDIKVMCM